MKRYLNENEQVQLRVAARQRILSAGDNPYRNGIYPTHTSRSISQMNGEKTREELEKSPCHVAVAGRIMAIRNFGKSAFIQLKDRCGMMQVFVEKNSLSEKEYECFNEIQVGDIVFSDGYLFRTKTEHLTIHATKFTLLTKSLRPLPEKFHGLQDVETRYRKRYLDLIMNPAVAETFRMRSKIISEIRHFLISRDFLEVETPMLHSIQGGTTARPFRTHHNALDIPLYLRIAPELHLKRLVVGGMERVFEINRNFRNEGVSIKHNPEFTLLEFYQSYCTYMDLIPFTEELIKNVVFRTLGTSLVQYQGVEIRFDSSYRCLSVEESIIEYTDFKNKSGIRDRDALLSYGKLFDLPMSEKLTTGELIMVIFDSQVEQNLIQPTFITHHPVDVSPLARRNEKDPFVVDRFELYIYGREIANAFSELNDPVDQYERFQRQVADRAAGNDEACEMDEDYIEALEYGLPPSAGEGIGIDRLVMILTDSPSIRDVILFPLMRG